MNANKKPNGMKGIINSSLDPVDFWLHPVVEPPAKWDRAKRESGLAESLLDVNLLLGLVQKSFFNDFDYDIDDPKWANVTPEQYRAGMKSALAALEADFWKAHVEAENVLREKCGMPRLPLEETSDGEAK